MNPPEYTEVEDGSAGRRSEMKKRAIWLLAAALVLFFTACNRESSKNETDGTETESTPAQTDSEAEKASEEDQNVQENMNAGAGGRQEDAEMKLQIEVGGSTFTASLEDNEAAAAFAEMMKKAPIVMEMDDYAGFEKVGSLGTSLPASNRQMTTRAGDIVLYNGSQIVIFYGSNSWSYTKLAEVDDLAGWEDALGNGNVMVTFSIEQ